MPNNSVVVRFCHASLQTLFKQQLSVYSSKYMVAAHVDRQGQLETRKQQCFFWSGTQTFNSCRSPDYARDDKSIITCSDDLCRPIKNTSMLAKNHPFTCCPLAKHPKHNKLEVTHIRENTLDFFNDTAQASTFAPAIILLPWVPLQS